MCFFPPSRHPLFDAACFGRHPDGRKSLLRVELDDELLGERDVDLGALGQLVDQDALTLPNDLQPGRDGAVALRLPRQLEGQRVQRLLLDVDDVVLRHPVARDVDLDTVDGEVTVAAQLASHPTGAGQSGPVYY